MMPVTMRDVVTVVEVCKFCVANMDRKKSR